MVGFQYPDQIDRFCRLTELLLRDRKNFSCQLINFGRRCRFKLRVEGEINTKFVRTLKTYHLDSNLTKYRIFSYFMTYQRRQTNQLVTRWSSGAAYAFSSAQEIMDHREVYSVLTNEPTFVLVVDLKT